MTQANLHQQRSVLWGYGIPACISMCITSKREEDRRPPVLFMPLGGRVCGTARIATCDTFVEPCLYFL